MTALSTVPLTPHGMVNKKSAPWGRELNQPQNRPSKEISLQNVTNSSAPQCKLLTLPPELRLQVYSYLMPGNERSSTSRALRGTCHQVKRELDHEIRKKFMRDLMVVEDTITPDWIRLSANPQGFQVTAVVDLPQHVPPPLPGAFPRSATYLDTKLEEVVTQLPSITRSMAVVLKPHPQCIGEDFETLWTDFCGSMHYYLHRVKWEVSVGKLDLRKIQIFVANPVAFAMKIHYGPFQRKIPGIDVIGLTFMLNRNGACRMHIMLPPDQKFKRFASDCMKLVYRTMGKLTVGYKSGCV